MNFQLSKLSNLQQRVLIGLPGAAIIIWGICVSEWFYFLFFFIISLFSLREFYKLIQDNGYKPLTLWGSGIGIFLFVSSFLMEMKLIKESVYIAIFPLLALVFFFYLYRANESRPFINIALTLLGIVYVAIPFALLNLAVFSTGSYKYELSVGIILLIWASDTGAYFAGKLLGRKKLFERISPKKTWEGSIGGALLSIAVAIGLFYLFHVLDLWQWLVLALIIIVAGTYGDLIESMFKRSLEIKDSGKALMGHGGFLDRFDGLLMAAPFIAAFLKIFL